MDGTAARSPHGARWPWAVWTVVVAAIGPTIYLTVRNGSLADDPVFIPIAIVMMLGYATVGAILSSRTRGNPVGWLLLIVAVLFLAAGLSDEYLRYTYVTDPGSLPFGPELAVLTSIVWLPMIATIGQVVLRFPDGRVPGPRWRFVTPVVVAALLLFVVGVTLAPGPVPDTDVGVAIVNPFGIDALGDVADLVVSIGAIVVMLGLIPAVAAVVVRYRRSQGEERQQLRWLFAIVAAVVAAALLATVLAAIIEDYDRTWISVAMFLFTFSLVGVGVPAAIGVAVLRYRLYELDVVVKKTVVFGIVVVLLTTAFLVLAGIVGGLVGRTIGAAVVVAFVVGVLVVPTWRVARAIADRVVYGGRTTPYEALTEFSDRLSEAYATDDVLPRMVTVLGESTRAAQALVWVRVGGSFRAAATWPGDAPLPASVAAAGDELPPLPGDAAVEIRHRGELLGALTVASRPSDPVEGGRVELMHGLAAQAGLVLRNVRLIEELRDSRRRIVAAQDARAKKLERDIHDGAQQQLVALAVKARLASTLATKDPARTSAALDEMQRELTDALQNLRDLARGIYPPLLADEGLAAALTAQARKSPMPVEVDVDGTSRYDAEIEATVYFSVLEALQNVAKYADAATTRVTLSADGRQLTFAVTDDGRGFDAAAVTRGSGLQGIADRLSAVGGSLDVSSAPGNGTTLRGTIPVPSGGAA